MKFQRVKNEGSKRIGRRTRMRLGAVALSVAAVAGISLAGAAPANAITVGVCTMQVQNAHPSTHVNGTINVVGTATCTVTMNEIYVHVVLQRSDGATWPGNTNDYFNTTQEQSNAAAPCSAGPGTFRGYMSYVLKAPTGYSPAYSSNTIYGVYQSFACGTATFAKAGGAQPEPLTISIPIYKK
jgi:hypothetical protein